MQVSTVQKILRAINSIPSEMGFVQKSEVLRVLEQELRTIPESIRKENKNGLS